MEMDTYITLLRGINLGGKKKILMADLKQLFCDLGFSNVVTYIQTGNVIFTNEKEDILKLESKIEQAILAHYDFDVTVIIRTEEELDEIISNNPFITEGDVERLHITFLKNNPALAEQEKMKNCDFKPDDFKIVNKNVYIYCSKLYMDSKLGNTLFENKLKVRASTRNWKVVLKLLQLAKKKT